MADDLNDRISDFGLSGHLNICNIVKYGSAVCNRDCAARLYLVALRLSPKPGPTPPECVNHNEAQKRDGNPPWCSWCGWRREVKAEPARKVGQSADERSAGAKHLPWSPETGYGEVTAGMLGKPRKELDGEFISVNRPTIPAVENVVHRGADGFLYGGGSPPGSIPS